MLTLPVVVVVIVAVAEVLLLDLGKTLEAHNYSALRVLQGPLKEDLLLSS